MDKLDPARIVDWRIAWQFTIATAPSGGPAEPGDLVVPIVEARARNHGKVFVPRTSPFRLGLTISIRAAHAAQEIWSRLSFTRKARGPKLFEGAQIGTLHDYYEQCMVAASFAFQGLEGYINSIVEEQLQGSFHIERGKEPALEGGVETIQRYASTYKALKSVRDATIHPKKSDEGNVFAQFLHHEPTTYPRNALNVVAHYHDPEQVEWLRIARALLAKRSIEAKP
jgi:hypothetical protein